jgi:hypothetical protein
MATSSSSSSFFCSICNDDVNQKKAPTLLRQTKKNNTFAAIVGDGMGVRAALCISIGRFDRSFAMVDLFVCVCCKNKFRNFPEQEWKSFFECCKGLIVEFPDLVNHEVIRCKDHFDLFHLMKLYTLSPLNLPEDKKEKGMKSFMYMVQCKEI